MHSRTAVTAASAGAADRIYWTSFDSGKVHWANLDGSGGVHELNATGAAISPMGGGNGGAIDPAGQRYYWANQIDDKINWANLDGSGGGVLATGSATVLGPKGVSVDPVGRRVYWANEGNVLSYANLDGSGGGDLNVGVISIFNPVATTVFPSAGRIYWTNYGFITGGSIAFANLDGSGPQTQSIAGSATVDTPFGVAIDAARQRLYWANDTPGIISVANLDGTGAADIDRRGLEMQSPNGIALDPEAGIVYAANSAGDNLTELRVDGSGGATLPFTLPNESGPNFPVLYKEPRPASAPTVTSQPPRLPKPAVRVKGPSPLPRLLGSRLTCQSGAWRADLVEARMYRAPTSVSVAWTKDGIEVPDVAGNELTAGRVGNYRCRVTASNTAGATSQTTGAIAILAAGKAKLNKKKGTARLTVLLPGEPGKLALCAKGLRSKSKSASGKVVMPVKPKRRKKELLAQRGSLTVVVKLAYTTPGGAAATLRKRLTLKRD